MSNTVNKVGDLSGKHVTVDTVRIFHRDSVIEGVITQLVFTSQFEQNMVGRKLYTVTADISIGDDFHLNNVSLNAPAAVLDRSQPE